MVPRYHAESWLPPPAMSRCVKILEYDNIQNRIDGQSLLSDQSWKVAGAISGLVAQDQQFTWVGRTGTVLQTVGPPGPYRGLRPNAPHPAEPGNGEVGWEER